MCGRENRSTTSTFTTTKIVSTTVLAKGSKMRLLVVTLALLLAGFAAAKPYGGTLQQLLGVSRPVIECPGGSAECPDGDTCCKLSSGQYGCCPLPSAVCCSDHLHCCPQGTTCDVSAGKCTSQGDNFESFPMLQKVSSPKIDCPGGGECPDGDTCCQLSSGQYGCCPLPSAVCCSDHLHCCPQGTTCDVSAGKCTSQGDKYHPLLQLMSHPNRVL